MFQYIICSTLLSNASAIKRQNQKFFPLRIFFHLGWGGGGSSLIFIDSELKMDKTNTAVKSYTLFFVFELLDLLTQAKVVNKDFKYIHFPFARKLN
jgi:hypothetical protein